MSTQLSYSPELSKRKPGVLMPGELLKARFRIVELIGEGGFARVYLAVDEILKRDVAIKIFKLGPQDRETSLKRIQRELQLASRLRHDNIVTTFSIEQLDDQTPFIVMEYLQGISLQKYLLEHGKLNFETCNSIFSQISLALAYAHNKGVLHRDLSPANILLLGSPDRFKVKIIDFGLARQLDNPPESNLSKTAAPVGNPYYMSPEQCRGELLDEQSDIYSFGCILYQALQGRVPFADDNPLAILYKHQYQTALSPKPNWNNKELATKYAGICLLCMQKQKTRRFCSAVEIAELLLADRQPPKRIGAMNSGSEKEISLWFSQIQKKDSPANAKCLAVLAMLCALIVLFYTFAGDILLAGFALSQSDGSVAAEKCLAEQLKETAPNFALKLYEDLLAHKSISNNRDDLKQIHTAIANPGRQYGYGVK